MISWYWCCWFSNLIKNLYNICCSNILYSYYIKDICILIESTNKNEVFAFFFFSRVIFLILVICGCWVGSLVDLRISQSVNDIFFWIWLKILYSFVNIDNGIICNAIHWLLGKLDHCAEGMSMFFLLSFYFSIFWVLILVVLRNWLKLMLYKKKKNTFWGINLAFFLKKIILLFVFYIR